MIVPHAINVAFINELIANAAGVLGHFCASRGYTRREVPVDKYEVVLTEPDLALAVAIKWRMEPSQEDETAMAKAVAWACSRSVPIINIVEEAASEAPPPSKRVH